MEYSRNGVTVATIFDTRLPSKKGLYSVRIRVTYARVQKYYATGKRLTLQEWEKLPTSKARDTIAIRKDIEHTYQIVRDTVADLLDAGAFSLDALDSRLRHAGRANLNAMFRARIEELRTAGRIGSMLAYDNVLKGIERFHKGDVPLNAVTISWITRYADFLRNKEGKTQTTVAIHLRTLRAVLNIAKADGILKDAQYPFGRGKYEIQEGAGRKMAITLEQVGQIARYDDGTEATAKYRDYWLFIYLCNGVNVADMVQFKYSDLQDDEITFVRQKTARTTKTRKEIRVEVTEPLRQIIERRGTTPATPDRYIFPILAGDETPIERKHKTQYFTRLINRRISEIGDRLGIGHLSTYTARHTFATVLKRSGANIAYISESLGHSDLRTTENYLASFERAERKKNANILTQF